MRGSAMTRANTPPPRRRSALLLWTFLLLGLGGQRPQVINPTRQGQQPIDFLAYARAADALRHDQSPYGTVAQSRAIWRAFHAMEVELRAAAARGAGPAKLREVMRRPQQPGPYLYPPTLALLIAELGLTPLLFVSLSLLAILGWGWLWLRSTGLHPVSLLLILGSLDVAASLNAGNVELLLLCGALAAAWLLWQAHPFAAAPLIACSVLVKPFYALFFVAFVLLLLVAQPQPGRARWHKLAWSTVLVVGLVLLEGLRWGPTLRAATLHYLAHALDYQWFGLPVAEQTPMSQWNRTPLQALVVLGVAPTLAQGLALGLWLMALLVTLLRLRGRVLTWPHAFALAVLLLYIGRPIGWTLAYLEIVLVGTLWPGWRRGPRALLLAGLVALMLSHWWALILTVRGEGMPLVTLQWPEVAWETWLVLPLSWWLVLSSAAAPGQQAVVPPAL